MLKFFCLPLEKADSCSTVWHAFHNQLYNLHNIVHELTNVPNIGAYFFQMRKCRTTNLPKVTDVVSGRAGINTQGSRAPWSQTLCAFLSLTVSTEVNI